MSILTTDNYLTIVNGALITDILVIILLIQGSINSNVLIDWYKTYNLSAAETAPLTPSSNQITITTCKSNTERNRQTQ